ncbi:Stk1 family PASTA domain-containing Ser/Thr kinase [Rhabdothermincola sediminis]|uniref:Stk1 family PASTA domain-containing Ser/Thr kinase n=1 Tax=Rhabdothermincola sediminis TaxID=2751370 RepID=UPI001AA06C91|nr:Stk1 family PASTA domain-containing Ser/Thr kinase [Rhabdothermincola sediminis]
MPDEPRAPTVFNERYELHRKVARGGMSDVYLARDLLLDRPVAVKVLFPEYAKDETFVERFRREARAAANLNHPNVVAVYDWGQQYGTYFIVMEYVEGRSLSEIIRTEGPLHPTRAAEIAADVAAALAFAHRNGVIHRDIKPGNILLTSTGQVKVADFGIAQAASSEATQANLTQVGAVMGTATYFSPEQAQGKPIDPRSDLYSLGCVLYEMLTTRPPFSGETPVAIAYRHVQDSPEPPSAINRGVPAALEAIDLKLLAKDPAERYPSAEDLRTDLRRFLDGKPVAASGGASSAAAGAALGAGAAGAAAGAMTGDPTVAVPATQVGAGVGGPGRPTGPVTGMQPEYAGPGEPPRKRTSAFLAGMIILLLVLAGVLVVLGLRLSRSSEEITVPDVRGLTVQEAQARLSGAGLKSEIREEPNADVPAGQVFEQTPAPGAKAARDSVVTLRVSAGLGKAEVPDVVGRTEAAARSLIERAGFVPDVRQREDDTVPAGQVISQDPPGRTQAERGSAVTIVVSAGPAPVTVPDLAGLTVAEASNALGQRGFRVTQSQQASTSVPAGTVIATDPPANTELPKGSTVRLIVSSGPPETTTTTTTSTTSTSSTTTTTVSGGGGGGG